jgi:hypothetical protein
MQRSKCLGGGNWEGFFVWLLPIHPPATALCLHFPHLVPIYPVVHNEVVDMAAFQYMRTAIVTLHSEFGGQYCM